MTRKIKYKLEYMFIKHYAPNRCEPSIEVIVKMGVRLGGLVSNKVWGRGRCVVNAKKGGPVGGQCGCEPRIELIVKMNKKVGRGGGPVGGGVRVVVNHELKLLQKWRKESLEGVQAGGGSG